MENRDTKTGTLLTNPSFSLIIRLANSTCSCDPRMMKIFSFGFGGGLLSSSQNAPDCWLICLIVSPPEIKNGHDAKARTASKEVYTFAYNNSGFGGRNQELVFDFVLSITGHSHAWSSAPADSRSILSPSTSCWTSTSRASSIRSSIHTAAACTSSCPTPAPPHLAITRLRLPQHMERRNKSWRFVISINRKNCNTFF